MASPFNAPSFLALHLNPSAPPANQPAVYEGKAIAENSLAIQEGAKKPLDLKMSELKIGGGPAKVPDFYVNMQAKQGGSGWDATKEQTHPYPAALPSKPEPPPAPLQPSGNPMNMSSIDASGSQSAKLKPGPQPIIHPKPGQPMISGFVNGTVFKIEGEKVSIYVVSQLKTTQRANFQNPESLKNGASVCMVGPDRWMVNEQKLPLKPGQKPLILQPGPLSPSSIVPHPPASFPVKPGVAPPKIEIPGPGVQPPGPFQPFPANLGGMSNPSPNQFIQEPPPSQFEVPPSSVEIKKPEANFVGKQGQMPAVEEQKWPMKPGPAAMKPYPQQAPPVRTQVKLSNLVAIQNLGGIYSAQMNNSLRAIQESISAKYCTVYWSRNTNSLSRSLSAYVFQCVLFESVIKSQKDTYPCPVSKAVGLQNTYPPTSLSLKHQDFESANAKDLECIDRVLSPLISDSEDMNFERIAETLQVCIVLIKPTGETFQKETLFPAGSMDKLLQKVVLIAKPPYPVLVSKKVFSLFDTDMRIRIPVEGFLLYKQKRAPPKVDARLRDDVTKLNESKMEMIGMAETMMEYVARLLGRFEEMIGKGELSKELCSTDMGTAIYNLWTTLDQMGELSDENDSQLKALRADIFNSIKSPWTHFSSICSNCQQNYINIRLSCGHDLCSNCIGNQISQALLQGMVLTIRNAALGVLCPICEIPIMKSILKTSDMDLYKRLMKQYEQQSDSTTCSQCDKLRASKLVYTHTCKHTMCYMCARNQITYCKLCMQQMNDVPATINSTEFQCENCRTSMLASYVSPVLCDNSHILCSQCLFYACKEKCCIIGNCQRPFKAEELEEIKGSVFVKCLMCQVPKSMENTMEMSCKCVVCKDCGIDLSRQYNEWIKCWYCTTPFPQETIKFLADRLSVNSLLCCYCNGLNSDIQLFCEDHAHSQCFYNYVLKQVSEDPIGRIDCGRCGIEVYPDFVYEHVNYMNVQKYADANKGMCRFICLGCKSEENWENISTEPTEAYFYSCAYCGVNTCIYCMKEHSQHPKDCIYAFSRKKAKNLETKKIQAIACPSCKLSTERKAQMPSQKCEFCQTEFCSECSVSMSTINSHGGNYHRPDCSKRTGDKDATFKENCQACAYFGDEGCMQPGRLARRGVIPPGVYS